LPVPPDGPHERARHASSGLLRARIKTCLAA